MKKYIKQVMVKLSKEVWEKLRKRADLDRRKPGQMARILIEDGLSKKN